MDAGDFKYIVECSVGGSFAPVAGFRLRTTALAYVNTFPAGACRILNTHTGALLESPADEPL